MLKKTLVFTATYNEFINIKILLNKINTLGIPLDILIIDDNSTDGTLQFLIEICKKQKNLKLIIRKKKLGLDTAHKMAFKYAINKKYNYLITMDSDLSHQPKVIKTFIKLLKKKTF